MSDFERERILKWGVKGERERDRYNRRVEGAF